MSGSGVVEGKRYFECRPNHGIFMRPDQVGAAGAQTPTTPSSPRKAVSSSSSSQPTIPPSSSTVSAKKADGHEPAVLAAGTASGTATATDGESTEELRALLTKVSQAWYPCAGESIAAMAFRLHRNSMRRESTRTFTHWLGGHVQMFWYTTVSTAVVGSVLLRRASNE